MEKEGRGPSSGWSAAFAIPNVKIVQIYLTRYTQELTAGTRGLGDLNVKLVFSGVNDQSDKQHGRQFGQ